MLTFSINSTVSEDVPESLRRLIGIANRSKGGTPKVLEDIGDLYLSIADPIRKKVSSDVKAYAYLKKAEWTKDAYKNKYETNIVTNEETDDDEVAKNGVSEDILKYVDNNLDRIAESSQFADSIKQLKEMSDVLEIEEDINLLSVMLQALRGNLSSIAILKDIKDKYKGLGDLIYTVLAHGNVEEVLGGLIAV